MTKEEYFIEVTKVTSKLSTCASKQVGALLVKDNRILAIGYNGVPAGHKHCNEIFNSKTIKLSKEDADIFNRRVIEFSKEERVQHSNWSTLNEIHAEQNLIAFCAKNGIKTDGAELYCSLSPCIHCAKIIYASGITKVYYLEEYDRDKTGIEFLSKNITIKNLTSGLTNVEVGNCKRKSFNILAKLWDKF